MTTEKQYLAMAIDHGDDFYNISPNPVAIKSICDKYTTRDAVVEAIRRKGENDLKFQNDFLLNLSIIYDKLLPKDYNFYFKWKIVVAEVEILREAYLKASGLWVEESTGDKTSPTQNSKVEEEVVLPTKNESITRCNDGTHNALDRFISNYQPSHNLPYSYNLIESFRTSLKEVIAEVRRGL